MPARPSVPRRAALTLAAAALAPTLAFAQAGYPNKPIRVIVPFAAGSTTDIIARAITDKMAAGVNCAFTQVLAGLDIAGFKAGRTVAIQGAGGLGVYACAVAREMGASRVIVIDSCVPVGFCTRSVTTVPLGPRIILTTSSSFMSVTSTGSWPSAPTERMRSPGARMPWRQLAPPGTISTTST